MVEAAAIIATVILFGLAVFQVFLALGAPIGKFAWGGQHQVLPNNLRLASLFSLILYLVFALVILSKAGLIPNLPNINVLIWIFTGYFFLGILMNAVSRSRPERRVMTPVALVLAILFLCVAAA